MRQERERREVVVLGQISGGRGKRGVAIVNTYVCGDRVSKLGE